MVSWSMRSGYGALDGKGDRACGNTRGANHREELEGVDTARHDQHRRRAATEATSTK